jgi:hypothetical protein
MEMSARAGPELRPCAVGMEYDNQDQVNENNAVNKKEPLVLSRIQ